MTWSLKEPAKLLTRLVIAASYLTLAGCAVFSGGTGAGSPAAVSGAVRFLEREAGDTLIGPAVVTLEPLDSAALRTRPPQLFPVLSSTDRFEPGFSAVARGDYVVFVNRGEVSHSFFSADLDEGLQIQVGPSATSEPVLIDHDGESRFFCSLHPDENFSVFSIGGAFFGVVDEASRYYVGPLPGGSYRLSIRSPKVTGTIRDVQVEPGRSVEEIIWLDPELIGR